MRQVSTFIDMNVYDAALERIRWLFSEFDGKVGVNTSGGKDSTVILELAAQVARERGDGPVKAFFLDQEGELQATVDYMQHLQARDDVDLGWYQIPFIINNATNVTDGDEQWLHAWEPGAEWIQPRQPGAITENTYGTNRFYELLTEIALQDYPGYVFLDGMRMQESSRRRVTVLSKPMYKWVTWSNNRQRRGALRFQPIYDWSFNDVWKAIYDNDWTYNAHYDHMYRYGITPKNMRVSSFTHDKALRTLTFLQEVEPETWERATKRLSGFNTFKHTHEDLMPSELPYMFTSWTEYLHYLIDNLLPEQHHEKMRHDFDRLVRGAAEEPIDSLAKIMIRAVLSGDFYGIAVTNKMDALRLKRKSHGLSPSAPVRESEYGNGRDIPKLAGVRGARRRYASR